MTSAQEQQETIEPILELDPEVAADTAPPVADEVLPQPKISLQQMWEWLADETADRMASDAAFIKIGSASPKRAADIRMLLTLATSIAFLIDTHADIRAIIDAKNNPNVVPMKRGVRK